MGLYNLLFGQNPRAHVYLACLGLNPGDVGRFRDCYLKDGTIAVYTRNGGGNREDYMPDFSNHANLRDEDDDFDCTYATIYFSYPTEYVEILKALESGEGNAPPSEKWTKLLESMNNDK